LSSRANSGFPTTLHQSTATYAAFFKESRTRSTDATKPDRKSGGSRGICSSLHNQPMATQSPPHLVVPPACTARKTEAYWINLPFLSLHPAQQTNISPLVIPTSQTLFTFSQVISRLSVIPPSYSGVKITITITFPFTASLTRDQHGGRILKVRPAFADVLPVSHSTAPPGPGLCK